MVSRRIVLALAPIALIALALALTACGDGKKKKPIGAACDGDSQCASGLCYQNECLDPEADDDGDTLINRIEAALGTDPHATDSDGDGATDREEVDASFQNVDTDGDGKADALESATADADHDCVADQADPHDDDPGEGAGLPAVATVCPHAGVCGAAGAVLAVACPTALDAPVCAFDGVPGYAAVDDTCDGIDDDCSGTADDAGQCTGPLPSGCEDIQPRVDGTYEIDADGSGDYAPFEVQCLFSEELGDWTRLTAPVSAALAHFEASGPRQYLLRKGSAWYRSPVTTTAWSWVTGAGVDGTWVYQHADGVLGAFDCADIGSQALGVGCESRREDGFEVFGDPPADPTAGTVTVCRSAQPSVFEDGCEPDVEVYVRFTDCPPDPNQMLSDGGFESLARGEGCWYVAGGGVAGADFAFDSNDVPPGGAPPSLRAENPTVDNELYSTQAIQRHLTFIAGRTYVASFWAKAEAARTIVELVHTETLETTFIYRVLDIGTEWRRYELSFVAETSTYRGMFELQFGQVSTAKVWIDDVEVWDAGVDPCVPAAGAFLADGDFSMPSPICWEVFNNPDNPTFVARDFSDFPAEGDAPSLAVTYGLGTEVPADIGIIQRGLTLPSGRQMRLRFWLRAAGRTQVGFGLTDGDVGFAGGFESVSTPWSEHVIDFYSSEGAIGTGELQFQFGGVDALPVWIDGIVIEDLGVGTF